MSSRDMISCALPKSKSSLISSRGAAAMEPTKRPVAKVAKVRRMLELCGDIIERECEEWKCSTSEQGGTEVRTKRSEVLNPT